jgi:succinate dehydrogenase / fumarate reductase iron-sulfur subunit
MDKNINIKLRIWRQKGPKEKGAFETYELNNVYQGSSFLEMLDMLNDKLIGEGKEPIAYDHDCREGICGMCLRLTM